MHAVSGPSVPATRLRGMCPCAVSQFPARSADGPDCGWYCFLPQGPTQGCRRLWDPACSSSLEQGAGALGQPVPTGPVLRALGACGAGTVTASFQGRETLCPLSASRCQETRVCRHPGSLGGAGTPRQPLHPGEAQLEMLGKLPRCLLGVLPRVGNACKSQPHSPPPPWPGQGGLQGGRSPRVRLW